MIEKEEKQTITHKKKKWSLKKKFAIFAAPLVVAGVVGVGLLHQEHESSAFQSDFFGALADQSHHNITTDITAPDITAPIGPYDQRLGYTLFPSISKTLEDRGFVLTSKATGQTASWHDYYFLPPVNLFPIYDEKNQAGLSIIDSENISLHKAAYPARIYSSFEDIPELVVKSLLYVENRERLEQTQDSRNYAIEWDRKINAVFQQVNKKMGLPSDGSGGSTLAEQLEKLRHSEGGRTNGMADKATQVFTASARAYAQDRNSTLDSRKTSDLGYINAVPLSGYPGFGEVIGMPDGLAVWFDTNIDDFNKIMHMSEADLSNAQWDLKAQYYRQTLALIMAVQRPTVYLRKDKTILDGRIDRYLPSFERAGIISPELKERALTMRLDWAGKINPDLLSVEPEKSINLVRSNLLEELRLQSVHDFDRMDIDAESTIDYRATQRVNTVLHDLADPLTVHGQSVVGTRMVKPESAGDIQYTFTLYENVGDMNYLRVQTDNREDEFNLNEDSMLELGSTAKFRTIITYLENTLEVFRTYKNSLSVDLPQLSARQMDEDGITTWVLDYLQSDVIDVGRDETLMLNAAMDRVYSARNNASFYTGGGRHRFDNFMRRDNWREVSVREALEDSINLPFIRMMEDIVHYTIYNKLEGVDLAVYDEFDHLDREKYLDRFILHDAVGHFTKIYKRYKGLDSEQVRDRIFAQLREDTPPAHLAATHRYIYPESSLEDFSVFLAEHTGESHQSKLDEVAYESLHRRYAKNEYDINDRAYITDIHPIELWMAATLIEKPSATWKELRRGAVDLAPEIYTWLKKSNNERLKTRHVYTMLEQDAFVEIHKNWKAKGFPFQRLIPSFATAIGVSGDTPSSLASLMGVVVNAGKRLPNAEFTRVSLGKDTPYERNYTFAPDKKEAVLDPKIAAIVKDNLENVVQNGTGRRAKKAITFSNGLSWPVGGKTGTGDNRIEYRGEDGRMIKSTARNRTATFVFTFGDKYYGSIVAYAPGAESEKEDFTSSLPVQAFKQIMGEITPILEQHNRALIDTQLQEQVTAKAEAAAVKAQAELDAQKALDEEQAALELELEQEQTMFEFEPIEYKLLPPQIRLMPLM
jgi:membrane peptidoglycan carboxypeptidase